MKRRLSTEGVKDQCNVNYSLLNVVGDREVVFQYTTFIMSDRWTG